MANPEPDSRTLVVGGISIMVVLVSFAYTQQTTVSLWLNPWWLYAMAIAIALIAFGIWEYLAPRNGWWTLPSPSVESRSWWRLTTGVALLVLLAPPAIILLQQTNKLTSVAVPWTIAAVLAASSLVAFIRRNSRGSGPGAAGALVGGTVDRASVSARGVGSIAARVPQGAAPRDRIAALGAAIREVLVARYGSADVDAQVDTNITAEVIEILDPLLALAEQELGRADTVTLIRMNGIFDTVRRLYGFADQLSILSAKVPSKIAVAEEVEAATAGMLEVDLRSNGGVVLLASMMSPKLWVNPRITNFAPYPLRVTHLTARLNFGQLEIRLALDQPYTIEPLSTRTDVGLSDTPDSDKVAKIKEFLGAGDSPGKVLYTYLAINAESEGGSIEKFVTIELREPELRTIIR